MNFGRKKFWQEFSIPVAKWGLIGLECLHQFLIWLEQYVSLCLEYFMFKNDARFQNYNI